MEVGALTSYLDVAQVVLYAFWVFFALLLIYIRREDKREGYPLVSDRRGGVSVVGFPKPPRPKTFKLFHGGEVQAPRVEPVPTGQALRPAAAWPGAPLIPTADPMQSGVGAASYVMRAVSPELMSDGVPKLVPMRAAAGYGVATEDPDPRGMPVVDLRGKPAGRIVDLWVDRAEMLIRYLEAEADGGARILIPMALARVDGKRGKVRLASIMADQLATAPRIAGDTSVTLREEDRISGYFGGGHLYAYPGRTESRL